MRPAVPEPDRGIVVRDAPGSPIADWPDRGADPRVAGEAGGCLAQLPGRDLAEDAEVLRDEAQPLGAVRPVRCNLPGDSLGDSLGEAEVCEDALRAGRQVDLAENGAHAARVTRGLAKPWGAPVWAPDE
jgi:hypothetical protein